jgi:polyisoprenoid-binding protein YceI
VKQYPTATFEINSAERLAETASSGHPRFVLDGQFTLHGKTQPLSVEAEAISDAEGLRLSGSFALQQTQFGIKPYRKAFGAVGVKDVLTVHGEIYLSR